MTKLNIAFFEVDKDEINYFKKKLKGYNLTFFSEKIQDVHVSKLKSYDMISVFIYSKVSDFIMSKIPSLKAIITRSTGFDHIDINYAKENNIQIGNVPFYGENTVAEHAFALLLNLSRNIYKSYLRSRNKNFSTNGLRGFDLRGKTLGVIGVGHIGMHMIRMGRGFGMKVKAYDIHKDEFTSEILGYEYDDIDNLLKTSDVISLHMPYNNATHHFINKDKISKMKKGVILINTSRGALVDTKELFFALKSGKIWGCGLDVIEGEEFIMHEDELLKQEKINMNNLHSLSIGKEILEMDNVIFTPHNAFNSNEAILRILDTSINNIIQFKNKNLVKYSIF